MKVTNQIKVGEASRSSRVTCELLEECEKQSTEKVVKAHFR